LITICYKIVDSQTSFTLCEEVGKFWKLGVGHFTSDSATLVEQEVIVGAITMVLYMHLSDVHPDP